MKTTYYFIRHAEKETSGKRNPNLTEKGQKRAENWAEVLKDKGINMIFCTELKRTQQTAEPLAEKLHLKINIYDLTDLYNITFQEKTKGKTVLVVGHQDTTPAFVNRVLRERRFQYIKSSNHGNLYQVIIENNDITAELFHIEF